MSERGPSFGGEYDATPEQALVHDMRQVAYELLGGPEDALSREIAEKLLLKANVKERVDAMLAYADDVSVHQDLKQLGTLVVREAEALFDYDDPDSGFNIQRGDNYLDVHIPPVPGELRNREAAQKSLTLVREYILAHELTPRYVMGVTYERIGEIAKRFGFNVAHPDPELLPDSIIRGVRRVHEQFTEEGRSGRDMGLPVIVFKDTAEFIEGEPAEQQPVRKSLFGLLLRNQAN